MLLPSSKIHQLSFFNTELLSQLDVSDTLLLLANCIPWQDFESSFSKLYSVTTGRPAKPIRLMAGLLILKQLENLSDEALVLQFKRNPYYQAFCGLTEFTTEFPCASSELVHFRKRIGSDGVEQIFSMSASLHGNAVEEK